MSLWLATLSGQVSVFATALAGPPALKESAFWLSIASVVPHIPGLIVLGGVCAIFRNACYIGHPLGTDEASSAVLLISDAMLYMLFTYWIARDILKNAERHTRGLRITFIVSGSFALLTNGAVTGWMIWAEKPYYVHPVPHLSILSFVFAALTFLSAFWRVKSHSDLPAS